MNEFEYKTVAERSQTTYRKNNNLEKCAGIGLNGSLSKKVHTNYFIKVKNRFCEQFRSCQLNSTANPADFHQN